MEKPLKRLRVGRVDYMGALASVQHCFSCSSISSVESDKVLAASCATFVRQEHLSASVFRVSCSLVEWLVSFFLLFEWLESNLVLIRHHFAFCIFAFV